MKKITVILLGITLLFGAMSCTVNQHVNTPRKGRVMTHYRIHSYHYGVPQRNNYVHPVPKRDSINRPQSRPQNMQYRNRGAERSMREMESQKMGPEKNTRLDWPKRNEPIESWMMDYSYLE